MNQPALDALARPVVLNPVEDLPPFVQSLKDQAAAKGETDIDQYFMGDNRKLTVQELQAREDEKAFMLGNIDYAQQTLPTPEEQLRNGAYAMPNGGAVGGQQPGQPNQGQTPTAAQAQFTQSPETLKAQQELAQAQSQSPQMRQVERQPVSQRDAIVSTILATLFPQQSTGILQAPGAQAERQYQEESQKAQNQFALDDRSHKQRLDVLKALLESAMEGDQRRFESDKFNTSERNDMTVQARGQDMMLQRAQEGNETKKDIAQGKERGSSFRALLKQAFDADSPEMRAEAASQLKLHHGYDVHDPASFATLTPSEKLTQERAKDMAEKRPFEIKEIISRTGVNEQRAKLIHKEVENFDTTMRIKLAMLRAYLDNTDSLIRDRELDREQRGMEFYNKQIEGNVEKAEKELDVIKKDIKEKREEFDKLKSALDSGYYNDDPAKKKYAEQRFNDLYDEMLKLHELKDDAVDKIGNAKSELGGFAPADPVSIDPSLKGPIGNRRSRKLKALSQNNPYL